MFAIHQAGGFNCVQVFFFRTGQNWGNRAYFPKADRSLSAAEVLTSFLAQFYDDKPCPRTILISEDFSERELAGGGADRPRAATASRSRRPSAARRRTWSITRSPMRARRSGASSPRPPRSRNCSRRWPRCSGCRAAAPDRGLRQQPHPGIERGRRDDRRRPGRLPQEPVSQVQYPLARTSRPATITA